MVETIHKALGEMLAEDEYLGLSSCEMQAIETWLERHDILSCMPLKVKAIGSVNRSHWGIELCRKQKDGEYRYTDIEYEIVALLENTKDNGERQ